MRANSDQTVAPLSAEASALGKDLVDRLMDDWHRERPDLDPSAMAIVGRVMRVGGALNNSINEVLRPHGLLYSEFDALATLLRSGAPYELTPKELQEAVVLTSGAMTALLSRLREKGLISRRKSSRDGRSLTARLTAKGVRLTNELIGVRFDEASSAVACLNDRERKQMSALLKKMGRWLDSER